MARATKTEIRDMLRLLHEQIGMLKDAVTANDGPAAVAALQGAEDVMEGTRDLLEDRFEEAFIEIEGEFEEEIEEEEEDE